MHHFGHFEQDKENNFSPAAGRQVLGTTRVIKFYVQLSTLTLELLPLDKVWEDFEIPNSPNRYGLTQYLQNMSYKLFQPKTLHSRAQIGFRTIMVILGAGATSQFMWRISL